MEHLTKENFEVKIFKSEKPVALVFFANWCAPCKAYAPIFAEVADEFAGVANFCKADVDKLGAEAQGFGVSSIPATVILKNGTIISKTLGVLEKDVVAHEISKVL